MIQRTQTAAAEAYLLTAVSEEMSLEAMDLKSEKSVLVELFSMYLLWRESYEGSSTDFESNFYLMFSS